MKAVIVHNHPIHYKHLLFQALKQQGLEFSVVFLGGQSSIRHEVIELSDDLYRSHVAWPGPYETAPLWRRIAFTWKKLVELTPDVAIISGYYAAECWTAWLWAWIAAKPIVLWFESNHFDYERNRPLEMLKRIFCWRVDRAHVYGHSNKEYLVNLGIPDENIDMKRAVVDVEHFAMTEPRPLRDSQSPTRLLYVGRLAPEKNISFLLRAFALNHHRKNDRSPMRLLLAGSGPCEPDLKAEASDLGIADHVDFLGYTPQADLPRLYQSADFFVLPSTREPWGLVALEAMLARMPILISTRCGCAVDVVTDGNGWMFSPYQVTELASLLSQLQELRPEQVNAMGEKSFSIAEQYTAQNCADVIIRSLSCLARRPKVRGAEPVDVGVPR